MKPRRRLRTTKLMDAASLTLDSEPTPSGVPCSAWLGSVGLERRVESGTSPGAERSGRSLRFAYADPPYFGLAEKLYGHLHPEAAEYDKIETHAALIARLCAEYDGWAMSLHAPSLRAILPLCPEDVRVMPWVKPWAPFRPGNKGAQYAWEPVIVRGGRPFTERLHSVRDYCNACMVLGGAKTGFGKGTKPEAFVLWLLAVWQFQPRDSFDDLFPGSGAVTRAVEKYRASPLLPLAEFQNQQHQYEDRSLPI